MSFFSFIKTLILVGILGLLGWIVYKDHTQLITLAKAQPVIIERKAPTVPIVSSAVQVPVSGATSSRVWSILQADFKDTVVQVFSHIKEFNWLQPYQAPQEYRATGSAFFVSEEGHLITNAHVVEQASAVRIQIPSFGKQQFDVTILGISPERDLALMQLTPKAKEQIIKVKNKIPVLPFGDSDQVRRGEEVMALGYPLGMQSLKSTVGVVSGREHLGGQHLIQISAPINPGNSGGPALGIDNTGNISVIGVANSGVTAAQNVGYMIPSNEVILFMNQLDKLPEKAGFENKPKVLYKPFLGVLFSNATETLTSFLGNPEPGGLYVVESCKNSPLEEAGVQAGDMIYAIRAQDSDQWHAIDLYGEMSVPWSEDKISILDFISRLVMGEKVDLLVYRKGERKEMSLVLKEASDEQWPLRKKRLPGIDYDTKAYEIIGGMVMMPLALNHIPLLINIARGLTKYTDIKNQTEHALIITHIFDDSLTARSRAISPGVIVSEVNNIPVKTLDDLRVAISASAGKQFFTVKTDENIVIALPLKDMLEQDLRISNGTYKISPTVKALMYTEGILGKEINRRTQAPGAALPVNTASTTALAKNISSTSDGTSDESAKHTSVSETAPVVPAA